MTDQKTDLTERLKRHIERNREHHDPSKQRDAWLAQDALNEIERLSADLAPKVKPLEWEDQDSGHLTTKSLGFEYEVGRENGEFYWQEFSSDEFADGFTDAIKAAKAAQADYERRILSALTLAPITPAQEARFVIDYLERETGVDFGDFIGVIDAERIKAIAREGE